jgi:GNAT superfamily N-acetyltransferase
MPLGARPNAQRYFETMLAAIEADLGHALPAGTTLVPAADRVGTGIAACYRFGDRSAVWCDPAALDRLAPFAGSHPVSAHDFVAQAMEVGAERRGIGMNRVLDGPVVDPQIDLGTLTIRSLDPEVASDVALIAALRSAVSDDDADEADLDLDHLDPHIVAVVEPAAGERHERLLAWAGARAAHAIPFDDIGVITHPAARHRGLGLACVHRLVEGRQSSGTPSMYRCEAMNHGSGRIAERLGFDLVQVVGAVTFGP